MKSLYWASAVVVLLLMRAGYATAGLIYTNGPIDGSKGFYAINNGSSVTDSFTVTGNKTLELTDLEVGLWLRTVQPGISGDVALELQWSVGTSPFGSDVGSAISHEDNIAFHNFNGDLSFWILFEDFPLNLAPVSPNTTYWLTLSNATNLHGGPVGWDINSGPSSAFYEQNGSQYPIDSESFTLYGSPPHVVPEPASLTLLGLGALGLAADGWRRWKKSLTA